MIEKPRHDPLVRGLPTEFTVAAAMVPALFAGACQALMQAAAAGGSTGERTLDPSVLVDAELDAQLWLSKARYEQRKASASRVQTDAGSKAAGLIA